MNLLCFLFVFIPRVFEALWVRAVPTRLSTVDVVIVSDPKELSSSSSPSTNAIANDDPLPTETSDENDSKSLPPNIHTLIVTLCLTFALLACGALLWLLRHRRRLKTTVADHSLEQDQGPVGESDTILTRAVTIDHPRPSTPTQVASTEASGTARSSMAFTNKEPFPGSTTPNALSLHVSEAPTKTTTSTTISALLDSFTHRITNTFNPVARTVTDDNQGPSGSDSYDTEHTMSTNATGGHAVDGNTGGGYSNVVSRLRAPIRVFGVQLNYWPDATSRGQIANNSTYDDRENAIMSDVSNEEHEEKKGVDVPQVPATTEPRAPSKEET